MPELAALQLYSAFPSASQWAVTSATPALLCRALCPCASLTRCQGAVTPPSLPPSVLAWHTGAAYWRITARRLVLLLLFLVFATPGETSRSPASGFRVLHLRASSLLFVSRDLSACSKTRTFFSLTKPDSWHILPAFL